MNLIARELLIVARLLVGKKRPETRFEQEFFDIRTKMKAVDDEMAQRAVIKLGKEIRDAIEGMGHTVISADPKLGAFRGHHYVTSCKVFVKMSEKDTKALETQLRGQFSPKFNFKSYEDGVALFNVR